MVTWAINTRKSELGNPLPAVFKMYHDAPVSVVLVRFVAPGVKKYGVTGWFASSTIDGSAAPAMPEVDATSQSNRSVSVISQIWEYRQERWVDARCIPRAVVWAVECARWSVNDQARLVVAKYRAHAVSGVLHLNVETVNHATSSYCRCGLNNQWEVYTSATATATRAVVTRTIVLSG